MNNDNQINRDRIIITRIFDGFSNGNPVLNN